MDLLLNAFGYFMYSMNMLLDQALPKWEFHAQHHILLPAARSDVMKAIHEVTWEEAPLFRQLVLNHFGGRRIKADQPILKSFLETPFQILAESESELVIGCILKRRKGIEPTDQLSLAEFRTFSSPGCWKEVMNFHFADGRLTTQSRVQTLDPVTHRLFSAYWTLIRLPSGWIRRTWLQAIKLRAMQANQIKGQPASRSENTI